MTLALENDQLGKTFFETHVSNRSCAWWAFGIALVVPLIVAILFIAPPEKFGPTQYILFGLLGAVFFGFVGLGVWLLRTSRDLRVCERGILIRDRSRTRALLYADADAFDTIIHRNSTIGASFGVYPKPSLSTQHRRSMPITWQMNAVESATSDKYRNFFTALFIERITALWDAGESCLFGPGSADATGVNCEGVEIAWADVASMVLNKAGYLEIRSRAGKRILISQESPNFLPVYALAQQNATARK
jgi:hypothetical protein